MLDGWLVRQRGPGWGKKKTAKSSVDWHELKTGVFYAQEQAVMGERQAARPWVEKHLHQLRHGHQAAALKTIAGLKAGRGPAGDIIRREQNYFAGHAARMNYRAVADRGWAIGSGPVESACLPTAKSVQTQRPILDATGLASSVRLDRSTPKRSLASPMESVPKGNLPDAHQ